MSDTPATSTRRAERPCRICDKPHTRWSKYCSNRCQNKGTYLDKAIARYPKGQAPFPGDRPRKTCLICGRKLLPGGRVDRLYCPRNACRQAGSRNTWSRTDITAATRPGLLPAAPAATYRVGTKVRDAKVRPGRVGWVVAVDGGEIAVSYSAPGGEADWYHTVAELTRAT